MEEAYESNGSGIDWNSRRQYVGPHAEWARRKYFYQGGNSYTDLYQSVYEKLEVDPASSILDVGSADGRSLLNLRPEHTGPLYALDITNGFMAGENKAEEENLDPFIPLIGSAQMIPLADHSVDNTIAILSLYHTEDPEAAVREIIRVTKSDGGFGFATSGSNNKQFHHAALARVAKALNFEPPAKFNERFDFVKAGEILTKLFAKVEWVQVTDEFVIDDQNYKQQMTRYLESFDSMKASFPQSISYKEQWLKWRRDEVETPIFKQILARGKFVEPIEMYYFICHEPLA